MTRQLRRQSERRAAKAAKSNGHATDIPVKMECALIVPTTCPGCGHNPTMTVGGDSQSLKSNCQTPGCLEPLNFTVMITKGDIRRYLRKFKMPPGEEA